MEDNSQIKGCPVNNLVPPIFNIMGSKLCVIQFPHPSVESVPTRAKQKLNPIIKGWNKGSHKRKFMKAKGQIVGSNNQLTNKQDLLFWGEWEPASWVKPITQWQGNGVQPKWLHEPFLSKNSINSANTNCGSAGCNPMPYPNNYDNTDPFVFNDYFLYSLCRQVRKDKSGMSVPTQMQSLSQGSIILFGSALSSPFPHFALDTVFVVGESRLYHPCQYKKDLKGFIPKNYDMIMGFPNSQIQTQYTCYHGATVNNPIEGMYSFVPCKPYPGYNLGFPRVMLTNIHFAQFGNIIINSLSRNYHITNLHNNFQACKKIWDELCRIVNQQGYERGVNFEYK